MFNFTISNNQNDFISIYSLPIYKQITPQFFRKTNFHSIKNSHVFFYTFAHKIGGTSAIQASLIAFGLHNLCNIKLTLHLMQLFLVRHGETEENAQQILQGHLPGHLTTNGRKQAEDLAQDLATHYAPFDVMLVSNLQRTRDTAAILNQVLHIPTLLLCPLLRERDWGSFTGKEIAYAQTHTIPEDAESVEQLFERAKKFLLYVIQTFPEKRVLAVGHGLFNRTLQAALHGCTIRDIPRIQNAEVRELNITPQTLSFKKDATPQTKDEVSAN